MWRCDNVGGLGEHVKKHVLWFLRYTFFNFFCFIPRLAPSAQKWTDFDDLYVIRRVSAQGCAFWGVSFILFPILGAKSPKNTNFGGVNRHFLSLTCKILKFAYCRNYCTDYYQILHSHKDHQVLFVGGPNARKTNPRWRTEMKVRYQLFSYKLLVAGY